MTKDEALKLALEAPEDVDGIDTETECVTIDVGEAITAIREALAQQQEPVAWLVTSERQDGTQSTYPTTGRYKDIVSVCDFGKPIPLYTSPQTKPWVGLTEKEHTDIAVECGCISADWVFYGATVERKLKGKNS